MAHIMAKYDTVYGNTKGLIHKYVCFKYDQGQFPQ